MNIKDSSNKVFTFNSLYKKVCDMKDMPVTYSKEIRPPQFRLSSSPFCPYKFLFDWEDFSQNGNYWGFSGDFFTGCGTVIHSTLQKWIPINNPGFILGNWRCRHCCKHPEAESCIHCKHKCKFYQEAKVGPKVCPKCKEFMEYEEFHFLMHPWTSGHGDGILLWGDRVKELIDKLGITAYNTHILDSMLLKLEVPLDAYVLEYKSTTRNNVTRMESPKIEHKAQASMYAPAAQFLMNYYNLKVKIEGSLIKYIARDLPNLFSRDMIVPCNNEYFDYNISMTKKVFKAIKKKDVDLLSVKKLPCAGKFKEFYSKCPHEEFCHEYREPKVLKKMFNNNRKSIIKSYKDYKEKFSADHFIKKVMK